MSAAIKPTNLFSTKFKKVRIKSCMHTIAHQHWVIQGLRNKKKVRNELVRIKIHFMSHRRATPLRIQ